MEFGEKLQQLRRERALTQEQLAAALFVSRTAISKWESGRGLPGIESLRAVAAYFSVTVDELLSGEALLSLARDDARERLAKLRGRADGLLAAAAFLCVVLPCYGEPEGQGFRHVPLWLYTQMTPGMRVFYYGTLLLLMLGGVLTLGLSFTEDLTALRRAAGATLALHIFGVLLFAAAGQPYVTVLLFCLLVGRAVLLWRGEARIRQAKKR